MIYPRTFWRADSVYIPCGASQAYNASPCWGRNYNYYEVCDGIEHAEAADITVYPNPATESPTITASSIESVELINLLGQRALSQEASGNAAVIDVKHLDRGTYLLLLHTADGDMTKKAVLR